MGIDVDLSAVRHWDDLDSSVRAKKRQPFCYVIHQQQGLRLFGENLLWTLRLSFRHFCVNGLNTYQPAENSSGTFYRIFSVVTGDCIYSNNSFLSNFISLNRKTFFEIETTLQPDQIASGVEELSTFKKQPLLLRQGLSQVTGRYL